MNNLNKVFLACIACSLCLFSCRGVECKTIAVVDVKNAAYQGSDKFYGDSDGFRNTVASLLVIVLNEIENLSPKDYAEIRTLLSGQIAWKDDIATMPVTGEQAIALGKAAGLDFVVTATILEAKVKTSKKSFNVSLFGKRKYSIWNNVEITVYDAKTGAVFLTGAYSGQHQKSKKTGYFDQLGRQFGIDQLKTSIGNVSYNPIEFAQSDIGIPFTRVCEDFADEFAAKLGAKVRPFDEIITELVNKQNNADAGQQDGSDAQAGEKGAENTPGAESSINPGQTDTPATADQNADKSAVKTTPDAKYPVLKVDGDKIMIDAGKKDGLNTGMILSAFRVVVNKNAEKEFPLAKLEIIEVTESMAVAKITEIIKSAPIKPGDRVRPAD